MNPCIRPMTKNDLDAVHAIELMSYSDPWSREMLKAELNTGASHIALSMTDGDGDLLGFCFFWIIEGWECTVTNIAVHPNHRRQGLAEMLFGKVKDMCRAKNIRAIVLEVRESNASARSFYAKQGFQQIALRRNYYRKPKEDALVMKLELQALERESDS